MREKRNTEPGYRLAGVCLDCGKVFVIRPDPRRTPTCGHCGRFDLAARRIVREGED